MGGFDFDDKGLPAIRGIRQRDGHMRIVSFTTRQPTGPYEYVVQDFLKDRETLENVFGENVVFMRNLRDLAGDVAQPADMRQQAQDLLFYLEADIGELSEQAIQGTNMSEAQRFANLQRRYAGLALTNTELRQGQLTGTRSSQLLEFDNPFFVEGQRSAERVIAEVYERAYGGQQIKELSPAVQQALAQTGGSGILTLTPQLMQAMSQEIDTATGKNMAELFLPAYTQGQFFKLILDAKPMPMTEDERRRILASIQAVPNTNINPAQITALQNNLTDVDDHNFREALNDILTAARGNANDPDSQDRALVAAIQGSLQSYVRRAQIPERKERIGQYINRLMSVASTTDQKAALAERLGELHAAGDDNAGALLQILQAQYLGFIPPSDAVDAAVNAAGMGVNVNRTTDAYITGLTEALLAAQGQQIDSGQIEAFLNQLVHPHTGQAIRMDPETGLPMRSSGSNVGNYDRKNCRINSLNQGGFGDIWS